MKAITPFGTTFGAFLLAGTFLLTGGVPALAQVTVNPGALSGLHHDTTRRHRPARQGPAPQRAVHFIPPLPPSQQHRAEPQAQEPVKPAIAAPGQPPAVPPAPPNPAAIPPPAVVVPTAPAPPPPPIPVSADAPGTVTPVKGGLQVTFGAGSSTLNPQSVAGLRQFAERVKAKPGTALDLTATAAGTPDDPSTARRLSLERGLAVRAVLLNAGLVSSQIYVRAMGASGPPGPADRVRVVTETPPSPSGK